MLNPIDFIPPQSRLWLGGALFPVTVGLASSFTHCAGMCGPIHLFLASRGVSHRILWRYHAGRILGYGLLGGVVGFLGQSLAGLSSPGFRMVAGALLAILYALFGLGLLGWKPSGLDGEKLLGFLFPSRSFGRLAAAGSGGSLLFPAGLLASLLPCPSTHAVLLWGLGLGQAWQSAGGMVLLGFATLPVFAVLPRLAPAESGWFRKYYGGLLGLTFLGLSAWRFYGMAFAGHGVGTCH